MFAMPINGLGRLKAEDSGQSDVISQVAAF
jgi:hypothetical protein